jgi:LacI family transcriptional regulator
MKSNLHLNQPKKQSFRPVTIHDVAEKTGVSSTTVWRAMNGKARISAQTRKKILNAAKTLGYRPSMVAQSLVWQRTQTIGVIVPMLGDTVYSVMVQAVERVCRERGYNIILCTSHLKLEFEKQSLEMVIQRKVEGVIAIPFSRRRGNEYDHLHDVERRGIPLVLMELDIPLKDVSIVAVDNFLSAKVITNHLIALGRRRIIFLHGGLSPWDIAANQRFRGFEAALKENGTASGGPLAITPEIMSDEWEGPLDAGKIASLFKRASPPDAIFACNDMYAIKTMAILTRLGIHVPEDVAVVGFDDILMSEYTIPPLTTVRQPSENIGRRAAEHIFERLEQPGGKDPHILIERIPGKLIVRESCGSQSSS